MTCDTIGPEINIKFKVSNIFTQLISLINICICKYTIEISNISC